MGKGKWRGFYPLNLLKALIAFLICLVAVFLPYKMRIRYLKLVSFLFHLPYIVLGRTIAYLLRKLNIKPKDIYGYE